MNIREIIRKARQAAKTPDEVLLSERFEEYLDLLELRQQVTQEELVEFTPRLEKSLQALREVSEKVAKGYGMDPTLFMQQFSQPQHIGMKEPAMEPSRMPTNKPKRQRIKV